MGKISDKDRIAILHHTDPDGISSAVLLNKLLQKVRNKESDIVINQKPEDISISDETIIKIKENKISKLFIADLCIDQYQDKNLKKIEQLCEIVVFDHHKLYNDLNSDRIIFLKPQILNKKIDSGKYSASKFIYDLGNKISDLKEYDWVACIGLIGDQVISKWNAFHKNTLKRNKITKKKNILDEATEIIFLTESYDYRKVKECYDVLNNSKNVKQILGSRLKRYKKKVEEEIDYWKNNVIKFAEFYPNHELVFDYIKPRYSIKSAICSVISSKYPDKTIVIAEDMKSDYIKISVRRKDRKIAVNELLEKVLKGFKQASGGGHVNSAGGRIRKQDLYRFKDNILNMMENRTIFRS